MPEHKDLPQKAIDTIALFTFARRDDQRLAPYQLAANLRIRTEQVHMAEDGKRVNAKATKALLAYCELDAQGNETNPIKRGEVHG